MTAPMDLSDDDAAAVEFFERNAVSTTKGGMEINVSATVLQMAQRLSDARAALREIRDLYVDDMGRKLPTEFATIVDRALATPAPVAVPVCAKCKGSGKYDAQCAQFQCSGFHDCDCKTPLIEQPKKPVNGVTNFTDDRKADRHARLAAAKPTMPSDVAPHAHVRPGALYAAVFPTVPAILRLFIESACPLDAEMARGVLAAVEACK